MQNMAALRATNIQSRTQTTEYSMGIHELLYDADIDTDTSKAHSTRLSTYSAAKCAGMSTANLLKLASGMV
jgi:hypothetical protein